MHVFFVPVMVDLNMHMSASSLPVCLWLWLWTISPGLKLLQMPQNQRKSLDCTSQRLGFSYTLIQRENIEAFSYRCDNYGHCTTWYLYFQHTEHESEVDLAGNLSHTYVVSTIAYMKYHCSCSLATDFRQHRRVTVVEAHTQQSAYKYYSSEKYSARQAMHDIVS